MPESLTVQLTSWKPKKSHRMKKNLQAGNCGGRTRERKSRILRRSERILNNLMKNRDKQLKMKIRRMNVIRKEGWAVDEEWASHLQIKVEENPSPY